MIITKKGNIQFEEGEPTFRTCWKCNESHEYLKKNKNIHCCISCGKYFMNGRFLEEFKSDRKLFDFIKQSQKEHTNEIL